MTETPKDENEGTGGPSELSAGLGCDLRALLIACRGSVKTDLNAYERLLVAKQKHGEQETPTYTAADAEAQRLFALLAEIDALAGDYNGQRGHCPYCALEAERERAEYAWRNTRTIEAARQEEMRKRDAAEAALATLRALARASLDARDKEARAAMSLENAQTNFHRCDTEERAHEKAMIEASEADRALREALATANVRSDRLAGDKGGTGE